MNANSTFWSVILLVGLLNFLSRLSFIALFARVEVPRFVARAMRFVPAAMLTVIIVPAVAIPASGGFDPTLANPRFAAAILAGIVAWRTRSPTATVVVGMLALWMIQWGLRAAG